MVFKEMCPAKQDTVAAYQLAIESLPRPAMWLLAIQARGDGTTPGGVFAAVDDLRMELQIQIGELMEGSDVCWSTQLNWDELSASVMDKVTAYQLAIESLPDPAIWFRAIGSREDGTTPEGVFAAMDDLRMRLQIRIGDLRDDPLRSIG